MTAFADENRRIIAFSDDGVFLLISKLVFYAVVVAHCLQYRVLFPVGGVKVDDWLTKHQRSFWALHAMAVFCSMLLAQTSLVAKEGSLLYLIGSCLCLVIWDGGKVHTKELKWVTLINLHHLGVVIALVHQPEETMERAWRNTAFFSWLWFIHFFGFIQDTLLPLLGIPKPKDGEKHRFMEYVRFAYAAVSVSLFHDMINGEAQPALVSLSYQTFALSAMLCGRLLAFSNWRKVPFMKFVEAPGFYGVAACHLIGTGSMSECVVAAVMTAVAGTAMCSELLKRPLEEPPALPCEPEAKQLVLVRRSSERALVFENAQTLRKHEECLLTLVGGGALVPKASKPSKPGGDWLVIPVGVGACKERAILAQLDPQGFVVRTHDRRVLDVAWWKLEEENSVNLLNDMYYESATRTKGAGRSFTCNDDGTISPKRAPGLVLGAAKQ